MPIQKLQYRPGINKESTNYANEGGFYACDKIRFRSGFPEKIGGWANITTAAPYMGVARSLWNWTTYASENLLAFGTNQKYYVENGLEYFDITPLRNTTPITLSNNPFTTTSGEYYVNVFHTGHGADAGASVILSGAATFNGVTLNGTFEIIKVVDSDNYRIRSTTVASGSGAGGGASVAASYLINISNATTVYTDGWGTAPWGGGGWGEGSSIGVAVPTKLWSQDIFEQDLLFAYTSGPIYYWAVDTATYARGVTLQSYSNGVVYGTAQTLDTTLAGSNILYVDSTDLIDIGAVITGTANLPAGTYVTSLGSYIPATNSFEVNVSNNATSNITSGVTLSFSYAGRAVPHTVNYIVASDTSHFTIALGANPYDPSNFSNTFDPMLVRWSDQGNPYDWTPRANNQSGEQHLSNGSYMVCAQNTRQEILLWSDSALYSMQYVGAPFVWNFALIGDNTSIISQNAAISLNTVTYWMGVDKFYQYDGRLTTLNCTLWKYVYENLNKDQANQVVCGSNEGYSEIWWFYPSNGSQINDSYVIYNYLEQTWYYGSLSRSAWNDSPLRKYPMAAFSIQNSYLNGALDAVSTTIPVVNAASFPVSGSVTIDSEVIVYTGVDVSNNLLTGCVRSSPVTHSSYTPVTYNVPNQIMFHEYGHDDASVDPNLPIYAYVESSDFDIGDGHQFGFVWRILPDLTFLGSSAANPQIYLTVKARQNSGTDYFPAANPTVTRTSAAGAAVETYGGNAVAPTYTVTPLNRGEVYTRIRGRQMAFRIYSDALGVAWQLGTPRIDVRPDGRR